MQLSCCAALHLCVAILNSAKPKELKQINKLKPQTQKLGQKSAFTGLRMFLCIYPLLFNLSHFALASAHRSVPLFKTKSQTILLSKVFLIPFTPRMNGNCLDAPAFLPVCMLACCVYRTLQVSSEKQNGVFKTRDRGKTRQQSHCSSVPR